MDILAKRFTMMTCELEQHELLHQFTSRGHIHNLKGNCCRKDINLFGLQDGKQFVTQGGGDGKKNVDGPTKAGEKAKTIENGCKNVSEMNAVIGGSGNGLKEVKKNGIGKSGVQSVEKNGGGLKEVKQSTKNGDGFDTMQEIGSSGDGLKRVPKVKLNGDGGSKVRQEVEKTTCDDTLGGVLEVRSDDGLYKPPVQENRENGGKLKEVADLTSKENVVGVQKVGENGCKMKDVENVTSKEYVVGVQEVGEKGGKQKDVADVEDKKKVVSVESLSVADSKVRRVCGNCKKQEPDGKKFQKCKRYVYINYYISFIRLQCCKCMCKKECVKP